MPFLVLCQWLAEGYAAQHGRENSYVCEANLAFSPRAAWFVFLKKEAKQSKNKKLMRPGTRRSERLKAKSANAAVSNSTPDAVAEAVEAIDRRAEAAQKEKRAEKKGRKGTRGRPNKKDKEEHHGKDDGKDEALSDEGGHEPHRSKRGRAETDSERDDEHSEEEEKREKGPEDPSELKLLALYRITSDKHGKSLPRPYEISTVLVFKNPMLWPLLLEKDGIDTNHVVTEYGTDGEYVRLFTQVAERMYCEDFPADSKTPGILLELKHVFVSVALGTLFVLTSGADPSLLLVQLTSYMRSAERILNRLDVNLIERSYGVKAAKTYARRTLLNPSMFQANAFRAAIRQVDDLQERTRECWKCHQEVSTTFKDHREVCPKR